MNGTKPSLHPTQLIKTLCLGAAICALVGGLCFFGGRRSAQSAQTELSSVVVEQQLTEIRELATVTYAYTNMGQFENSNDFYGMKIPFTKKSFLLTYDGIIKAGVDLSKAQVKVSGAKVTITLPETQILSHQILKDSVEVFDEKDSIFNPFTIQDFTSFQKDQEEAMEKKAIDRGLLEGARERAISSIRQMLESTLPEDYSLFIE